MSYLQFPRLAFSGRFQADVSTVNNDPRHFDNASFDSSFQEFAYNPNGSVNIQKGWWNPVGTGIFQLHGCKVESVLGERGTAPAQDGAVGLAVGNAPAVPSGKLVDLDPDWQLASAIYGFGMSLVDRDGRVVMSADYKSNPFRDLWFTRSAGHHADTAASAMFQSILTNVVWNLDGIDSPVLTSLEKCAAAENNTLSVRLTTYGYINDSTSPDFGYGVVLGAIGRASDLQPESFILGRRFMPANGASTLSGIGCFSAAIDAATGTLQMDLSNALPLDPGFKASPLGPMRIVLLNNAQTAEGAVLAAGDYIDLGPLDQSAPFLTRNAGIQSVPLSAAVLQQAASCPFAIVSLLDDAGNATVAICEAPGGLEVRAETFAFRLDPNDAAANTVTTVVYAAQYGAPFAGAALSIQPVAPSIDSQSADIPPATTPAAAAPYINQPAGAISVTPASPVTDAAGKAVLTVQGPAFMGMPRGYIDGQLYNFTYNFNSTGANPQPQAVQQQFDNLSIMVFSSYTAPDQPGWSDVQPILQQYANLYPVMSQGLFDFSRQEQADANAFILKFVFDKPIDDPDQMPVTRDLSSAKRAMLIRYFDGVLARRGRPATTLEMFGKRCPTRGGGARCPRGEGASTEPAQSALPPPH